MYLHVYTCIYVQSNIRARIHIQSNIISLCMTTCPNRYLYTVYMMCVGAAQCLMAVPVGAIYHTEPPSVCRTERRSRPGKTDTKEKSIFITHIPASSNAL